MNTVCNHDRIFATFDTRDLDERCRAIADAWHDPHADAVLAQMLDAASDLVYDKVTIAAHLGDFSGGAGDSALRRALDLTGRGTRDVRCAAPFRCEAMRAGNTGVDQRSPRHSAARPKNSRRPGTSTGS
jgi:hypothetical protein